MFILKNKSKNKVGGKKRQREEISPRCLFLLRVTSMFRMVFSGLPSPTHKDIYKYMYRYMSPTYTRSLGLSCTNSHAHARAKPHKHKTGKIEGRTYGNATHDLCTRTDGVLKTVQECRGRCVVFLEVYPLASSSRQRHISVTRLTPVYGVVWAVIPVTAPGFFPLSLLIFASLFF